METTVDDANTEESQQLVTYCETKCVCPPNQPGAKTVFCSGSCVCRCFRTFGQDKVSSSHVCKCCTCPNPLPVKKSVVTLSAVKCPLYGPTEAAQLDERPEHRPWPREKALVDGEEVLVDGKVVKDTSDTRPFVKQDVEDTEIFRFRNDEIAKKFRETTKDLQLVHSFGPLVVEEVLLDVASRFPDSKLTMESLLTKDNINTAMDGFFGKRPFLLLKYAVILTSLHLCAHLPVLAHIGRFLQSPKPTLNMSKPLPRHWQKLSTP